MYDAGYYQGFGGTSKDSKEVKRAIRILNYVKWLTPAVSAIAASMKEPVAAYRSGEAEGLLVTKGDYENDKINAFSTLALGLTGAAVWWASR
jgi:hypothetical protein